jgi:hypothetical protein
MADSPFPSAMFIALGLQEVFKVFTLARTLDIVKRLISVEGGPLPHHLASEVETALR